MLTHNEWIYLNINRNSNPQSLVKSYGEGNAYLVFSFLHVSNPFRFSMKINGINYMKNREKTFFLLNFDVILGIGRFIFPGTNLKSVCR